MKLFGRRELPVSLPLVPYALEGSNSYFLGAAPEGKVASPCVHCVQSWLSERGIFTKKIDPASVPVRKDFIKELVKASTPHEIYEIFRDGSSQKLDAAVFPHPECSCAKENYISPQGMDKKTCFSFSPITSLNSVRYPTSEGNFWITQASGKAPKSQVWIRGTGFSTKKEESVLRAVDCWLKEAGQKDSGVSTERYSPLLTPLAEGENHPEAIRSIVAVGAGPSEEEAILNGLEQAALTETIRRYSQTAKNPMYVVGGANWLRSRVPFSILQQYDLYPLFYPHSMPCWIVGFAAFSRIHSDRLPQFYFGAHGSIQSAFDQAIGNLILGCLDQASLGTEDERDAKKAKLVLWWTHWIYRCPKLALREVLQLEPYEPSLDLWKRYFEDGRVPVASRALNHPLLPASLRTLQMVRLPSWPIKRKRIGLCPWNDSIKDVTIA